MDQKFHQRFAIKINKEEAEKRFVNRAYNLVFQYLDDEEEIKSMIATALGERYVDLEEIVIYIKDDFQRTLQSLETVYSSASDYSKPEIGESIRRVLHESEFDLGIRWENGRFTPSGAKILDEKLVNDSLRWLSDKQYESVLNPFSKGCEHLLHVQKRPELLLDVITDMYEALEALAKIVTARDRDLSGNAELLINKLGVSDNYKKILKEYISYANEFRHAQREGKKKPPLSIPEVESFVYLTGLFIRLATHKDIQSE